MLKRLLIWLRLVKKPVDLRNPDTVCDSIALILPLVLGELERRKYVLPSNLDDLLPAIHAALPEPFRGADTGPNRADFASVVQSAALLAHRVNVWIKLP